MLFLLEYFKINCKLVLQFKKSDYIICLERSITLINKVGLLYAHFAILCSKGFLIKYIKFGVMQIISS